MKIVNKFGAQGDVIFRKVNKISNQAVKDLAAGPIIVAKSETGHNHMLEGSDAWLYKIEANPLVCFLQIDGEYADVVHKRSFDIHETLRLPKGIWEVRRQRGMVPGRMESSSRLNKIMGLLNKAHYNPVRIRRLELGKPITRKRKEND